DKKVKGANVAFDERLNAAIRFHPGTLLRLKKIFAHSLHTDVAGPVQKAGMQDRRRAIPGKRRNREQNIGGIEVKFAITDHRQEGKGEAEAQVINEHVEAPAGL